LLETLPLLTLGGLGLLIALDMSILADGQMYLLFLKPNLIPIIVATGTAAWPVDRVTHFEGKDQATPFLWIIFAIALLRMFFQTWLFDAVMGRIIRFLFVVILVVIVAVKVVSLIPQPGEK
jgi:hypothetical protein